MKYLVCEVEYEFHEDIQRSLCRVSKPLQVFDTEEQAGEAWELMNPFYGPDLRIVSSDMLDEEFR